MNKIEAHTALVTIKEKFITEQLRTLHRGGSYKDLLVKYGPMFEILLEWDSQNEYLNVERDVRILEQDSFLDQVSEYGVTSFTYSDNSSNALRRAEAFEKHGYKLEGLTTVIDSSGVRAPAFLFTWHNPLVKD